MLLKLLLWPIWKLVDGLIALFPSFVGSTIEFSGSLKTLSYGLYFLPSSFWSVFLASVSFWCFTSVGWGLIEWVYKKIPGVS